MLVGLVHAQRPEPEPERERPIRRWPAVPWRTLGVLTLLVALLVAANAVGGFVAYLLLLVAVTVGCLAIDRCFGYWLGLTEHRQ